MAIFQELKREMKLNFVLFLLITVLLRSKFSASLRHSLVEEDLVAESRRSKELKLKIGEQLWIRLTLGNEI